MLQVCLVIFKSRPPKFGFILNFPTLVLGLFYYEEEHAQEIFLGVVLSQYHFVRDYGWIVQN